MGGRYLVSGAQLGMIAGTAKASEIEGIDIIMDTIISKQFIYNSDNSLNLDIEEMSGIYEPQTRDEQEYLMTCPKCLSEDVNITYVKAAKKFYHSSVPKFLKEEPIWSVSETEQFFTLKNNALFMHCRLCQYDWWEKPADER